MLLNVAYYAIDPPQLFPIIQYYTLNKNQNNDNLFHQTLQQ